jgi:hypothetical protein
MDPTTIVGIELIILSIVAFAYQRVTYTMQEKVIDVGAVAVAYFGGIVLLMVGAKIS